MFREHRIYLCVLDVSWFYGWGQLNILMNTYLSFTLCLGKPVMIVTEYMENGSLDSFLRVS